MRVKKFEKLFEAVNVNPIDIEKLKKYALGISICCAGEYGDTFYNESTNSIFVNLGDANPFDTEYLEDFMIDAISKDYDSKKMINIEIDYECGPSGDGWKIYDVRKNEFKDWKGW